MREISEQIPVRGNVSWDWSSQFRGLARVLGAILFFTLLPSAVGAVPSVTLAWSPSADTNVIGYNIYYGRASRTYTNKVDVGNVLTATVSNLVEGTTYYFAATAYNIIGMESTFSGEVTYSVPATALARLQIRAAPARQVVLTVTGPIGRTHEILATSTFTAWTVIGTVTVGASGSLEFIDTNAAVFPRRFYRTREKP